MYRYYIFDVKTKWKNEENLYRLLKTLYTLNLKYINYGELLYNQICNPIDIDYMKNCLEDYNAKLVDKKNFICLEKELTVVIIKYSRVIIVSNTLYPDIFLKFKEANKNLFVCNFKQDTFFYLTTTLEKVKSLL